MRLWWPIVIALAAANAQRDTLRILNGSLISLDCPPAEELVRTHMAPDFENPQLVRRLDWFHDDSLVASFQQETVTDLSRQWWVAGSRYELRKPFFELRISPTLPEDSGIYKCRLETDPLFASDSTSANVPLLVLVRPPAPSKPQLVSATENSLTINWSQSAGAAHRPLLRYSLLINQIDEESLRVLATKGNQTSTMISSLLPFTRYKISVRAENGAGNSEFGPEATFRTLGESPKSPPIIHLIRNGSAGCVDVAWKVPAAEQTNSQKIVGYRIMVHRSGSGAIREWYVKSHRQSLCSLSPAVDYTLSIEMDNGFGYSPPVTTTFRSDEGIPETPPEAIEVKPLSGDSVSVVWTNPSIPNGDIVSFQIYFKKLDSKSPTSLIRLVNSKDSVRPLSHNLTALEPSTTYQLQMSASTAKGESEKSVPVVITTDFANPQPPVITNLSYQCGNEIRVFWESSLDSANFYKVYLESTGPPTILNTTMKEILIRRLISGQKYSLRIVAVLMSRYSNRTELESRPSKYEVFAVDSEKCLVKSSFCLPATANCEMIAAARSSQSRSASTFIVVAGVVVFVVAALLFVSYSRRKCLFVKKILKKAEKKNNHETVSLVFGSSDSSIVGEPKPINVGAFEEHFNEMSKDENKGFRKQFEEIEADSEIQSEESTEDPATENRLKNRYLNIGAVERTRIRILSPTNGDGYINANYIDSCDERNTYIATQAPLPHTFSDFYGMIWQEKCNVIVVITNLIERGKRKCDQYWPPTPKTTLTFGSFSVTLTAEMPNANFVHRILSLRQIKSLAPERVIHQIHLTSWPDHGVPNTVFPLLAFINYVADIQSTGPIVVHCSAGVGRSGSFILIDSMRRHLLRFDSLNVFSHLKRIRRQRQHLVQTLDQFIFCHFVVRELIRHGITRQSVPHFPNYLQFLFNQRLSDGRTRLQMQFDEVCKCPHSPQCRFPIGSVTLPGYHRVDEFVVANWDKECPQMWKTVWEKNCATVVLFGADADVGDFFRSVPQRPKLDSTPTLRRVKLDTGNLDSLTVRREDGTHILLREETNAEERCIRIVRCRPSEFETNPWGEIEKLRDHSIESHQSRSLFVDPSNSSMSFVICALQSVGCQLEQERFVDVLQFLAAYRLQQCGCWHSQSNIEHIYQRVLELIHLHRG